MFSRIAAAYALLDGVRRLLVNLLFLLTLVTLAVVFWGGLGGAEPAQGNASSH